MKAEDIRLYFEYNEWANNRILAAAERVSPEQLTTSNELGWGDLRGALVHILDAEYSWFDILFGEDDAPDDVQPENFASVAALRTRWNTENGNLWRCLKALQDADLTRTQSRVRGKTRYDLVLWQALVHVVNHGTQHRSECAALLTGFGCSPGDMDFTLFLSSRR